MVVIFVVIFVLLLLTFLCASNFKLDFEFEGITKIEKWVADKDNKYIISRLVLWTPILNMFAVLGKVKDKVKDEVKKGVQQ